jgi:hypothetical protein
MDAQGRILSEPAPDKSVRKLASRLEPAPDKIVRKLASRLEYKRSLPLSSILVDVSPNDKITLVSEVSVNSGFLTFSQDSEDQVIKTCRTYGAKFRAHTLEKVNNDEDGDIFNFEENFYPVLHKMLSNKQDWTTYLRFRGRATFELGVIEWTKSILDKFGNSLDRAGIFGAVGVSCYPYHYCVNTWRAFLELWGPLTNTLHHGNGEMSVSLHDLKVIGGLPIVGIPYEEFIPENKEMRRGGPYPSTLTELLCIHSQLCELYKQTFIRWEEWITHFYRGKLLYAAYGENAQQVSRVQRDKFTGSQSVLKISKEGELAAFLAFWLSRFVLPSHCYKIRPETFYMACLMARGDKISLAPSVLGHIYHGLGEIITEPRGPGESRSCFPVHYVIGWLGEHFPCLYKSRADNEFPNNYPCLARYAGVEAKSLDITSARLIFRTNESVDYRPSPFIEQKGYFLFDDGSLSEDKSELLICIRSSLLPVRLGDDLWLEPYYPNRFARQFGFDQGVPSNKLRFGIERRRKCCIEDLAKAQRLLLRTGTGTHFYIPRSTYNGACTWAYCRWWMRACAPYLGRSVSFVYLALKKRPLERKSNVFVIKSLREVSSGLRRETLLSDVGEVDSATCPRDFPPVEQRNNNTRMGKHTNFSLNRDEGTHFKRARYQKCDDSEDETVFPQDNYILDEDSVTPEETKQDSAPNPRKTESQNLKVQKPEPKLKKPAQKRVVKSPLEGTESKVMNPMSESQQVEQVESELRDLGPQLKETEPRLQLESDSESISGGTEPIGSDLYVSENIHEDTSSMVDISSYLRDIFSSGLNERRRDLIIVEMKDILDKIASSQPLEKILDHREEVSATIIMLRSMVDTLGSGKTEFEWFAKTVAHTFELADQLSQNMDVIKKSARINAVHIRDLIRSHEECQEAKKNLDLQLLDLGQQLTDLKATEHNIREAEEQAQRLREAYETARDDLEEKIRSLKEASKCQIKLDEELRQARIDAQEDKLLDLEHAESLCKSHTAELDKQIGYLRSFGRQSE